MLVAWVVADWVPVEGAAGGEVSVNVSRCGEGLISPDLLFDE